MLHHNNIGTSPAGIQRNLRSLILRKKICLAGNKKLKIYGTLHCASGKRMNLDNRVFFVSEKEAQDAGYRPCGHCLPEKYRQWKLQLKQ